MFMKVISLKVNESMTLLELEESLESQQSFVGGYIQYVPITVGNKNYELVVNEEGKLIGLPMNFDLLYDGKIVDIVVGNAFITSTNEYEDLTEEDLKHIKSNFKNNYLILS